MPVTAATRRQMFNAVIPVLEKYGFEPLETSTVELADTLLGKYGEDEKLIYQFEDKGGRKLALRYDLTVPLARFVANNLGLLRPTFSRYQIGQVFRGENPQKGRRREFTQFDLDTVGSNDVETDANVICSVIESARAMGLTEAILQINDRSIFDELNFSQQDIRTIDKIDKIGRDEVTKTVPNLNKLEKAPKPKRLESIFNLIRDTNFEEDKDYTFNPYIARGLDYYTSTIFELKLNKAPGGLSIGGGGRYDNLIGMFAGRKIPAVGFSFGIDRIVELIKTDTTS